jgi:glutathione synthase/RimK-type ligase-like ATP-grasp enzyme
MTVLCDPWGLHPLSWIHRTEARSVAEELRRAGREVRLVPYRDNISLDATEGLLLRLSDPAMFAAVQALDRGARAFIGPSPAAMARCYDKYEAFRVAVGSGIDCPATALASDPSAFPFPIILKPRRGSDSLGLRLLDRGPIPARFQTEAYIAQEYIGGSELTVAVLHGQVGMPLRIHLPQGVPYSFFRKYLLRPALTPVADTVLGERVRSAALKIAAVFGIDWAARVDLIHQTSTGRLCFLECDVAPLVGARSAFAASLEAAGIDRAQQLRMLLNDSAGRDRGGL